MKNTPTVKAIIYFSFLSILLIPIASTAQDADSDNTKSGKSYAYVGWSITPLAAGVNLTYVLKKIIGLGLDVEAGPNYADLTFGKGINFSRNSYFETRSRSLIGGGLFVRIGDHFPVQFDVGLRTAAIISNTVITDGFISGSLDGPFLRINVAAPFLNSRKPSFLSLRATKGKTALVGGDVETGIVIDFSIRFSI